MRKHRFALIIAIYALGLAVGISLFVSGLSTPSKGATPKWTSSALVMFRIPPTPSDHDEMEAIRAQFTGYTTTVLMNEESALRTLAAAEASARAAQGASIRTARSAVTTYQPTPSGSNASIWACIIQHESGGNPTVYNHSGSGASGLYQFMPGTWGGYDGYANAADAPASVQTQYAYAYEAKNGWSAWRGDGCTPVG